MLTRRTLTAVVAAATLIAACGGDDATDSAATSAPAVTAAPDTTATPMTTPPTTQPPTTMAPTTTASPTTTTEAPLPEFVPVGLGEFGVGATTIVIDDGERDRSLTVEVWFPIDPADAAAGTAHAYSFITGDTYVSAHAVSAELTAAAPGPFPMVVYSHGSGGLRYIHSDYTETLASHGYVVVAPDHTGNTAVELVLNTGAERDVNAVNRPLDVIAVIDAIVDGTSDEAAAIGAVIDSASIAVTGHSFGGYTTYAVASGVTVGDTTIAADERIGALIPLAPAVGDGSADSLLTPDDLSRIGVPTLVMVGTDDATTPVDPNVELAWEHSMASPHYRVELVAAAHQSFTDVCDYQDTIASLPDANALVVTFIDDYAQAGCLPGQMPIERVKELTNTFAVYFLDSVFGSGEMLTTDTVTMPDDIIYDAK